MSGPQLSDDGRFWWDGQAWRPVPTRSTLGRSILIAVLTAIGVVVAGMVLLALLATFTGVGGS